MRRLQERATALVEETARRIWAEIPSYTVIRDDAFRTDVVEQVLKHHQMLIALLTGEGRATREDLLFARRHTADRVGRIPIADYLWAHRIYLGVIWDELIEAATDTESTAAILSLVGPLLDYINFGTTNAAEVYLEIEQNELASGERVRRDLLEDLVAGRAVAPGARHEAARDAGLLPNAACLVVIAVPRTMPDDEQVLRAAAASLRRACEARLTPLTVVRRDEIVVVAPVHGSGSSQTLANLTSAYERLAKQGVLLAIGVSTVHPGIAGVAAGHQEARSAADCLGPDGGVLALPALSAFDYLTSFRNPTAERLVSPAIRQFVDEDIAGGGVLTSTLIAYVACDFNVKALSARIYVHTNTARYRLNRIAAQTGRDLRKVADVMELLIAIRLAEPLGDRPPAAWT